MIREYVVKVTDTFLPGAFQRFESEWSPEQELIRCQDCKHRDPEDGKCECGHAIRWQLKRPDDWFCADGERREDDG